MESQYKKLKIIRVGWGVGRNNPDPQTHCETFIVVGVGAGWHPHQALRHEDGQGILVMHTAWKNPKDHIWLRIKQFGMNLVSFFIANGWTPAFQRPTRAVPWSSYCREWKCAQKRNRRLAPWCTWHAQMFRFKCGDVVNRMDFMEFMQTFIVGLYTSLRVFLFGRSRNFRKRVVRTFVGESWGPVKPLPG